MKNKKSKNNKKKATKPEVHTDAKRIEVKGILESNLCLGLAPNREQTEGQVLT